MATEVKSGLLFRVLLPCSLLSAVSFRYNGFSVVYLTLLLLIPLFPSPSVSSMKGSTKYFLRTVWCTGIFFLLLQGILQLTFRFRPPNGAVWEDVLKHLGIIRFSQVDAGNIVRLLAPDIGMTIVGIVVARLSHKLVKLPKTTASFSSEVVGDEEQEMEGDMDSVEDQESTSEDDVLSTCSEDSDKEAEGTSKNFMLKVTAFALSLKAIIGPFLPTVGKVLVTLLLGLSGMVSPSVTSAVYFGAFLGLGSWWACRRALSNSVFSTLCVFMAIFTAGHLGNLYLYQLPFFQELVPPGDIYARLLGMTALIRTNHTESWKLHLHPGLGWPEIISPLVLLLSYYTLVLLGQQWNPEGMEDLPTRSPSKGEDLELRSVLWTSGSEEDQVTPFPGGSWQDLPLLRDKEHRCPRLGLEGPALLLQEKRKSFSGNMTTSTETPVMDTGPSGASVLVQLAMRHSYVPALITMMVWSITHASWLGFVLLLWACVIWMARDHRRLALRSAPCLVGYANVLVLLNFAVGLRVSQDELFPGVPDWLLADLDLKLYPQPCLHLGAKSLYAFLFWLLLRQQVLERRMLAEAKEEAWSEESGEASGHNAEPSSALVGILGSFLKDLLVKYWIFVCAAMFFVVSFDGKVAVYKIIYIFLFLSWVALYQIHYNSWRRILKYFWMVMVSYSMVVLIAIYTYQFQSVAGFFNQTLGLSEEGLRDVGLERFDTVELFAKILLPATFLLACILQLHYFNEDFLKTTSLSDSPSRWESMSDCNTTETYVQLLSDMLKATLCRLHKSLRPSGEKESTQSIEDKTSSVLEGEWSSEEDRNLEWTAPADEKTSDWSLVIDKLTAGFLKLLEMVNGTQVFLWRILEIHVVKLVAPVVIWFTLQEVSLMNSLFYIFWVGALPYSKLRPHASRFSTVWACVIVICKMMYQLKCVVPSAYSSNCTEVWQGNSTRPPALLAEESILSQQLVDPAEWLGALRKCDGKVLPCLKSQLCILALMTLEVTVSLHQRYYRLCHQLQEPLTSTISDSITRAHLDEGLLLALKYFLNYGFYKFGLELCFVAALNAIGQRMDFYSLIHGIWLIYLLYLRRRKAIAEVWPRYCGFLVGLAIFQYFLCLGLPPAFCTDYPWRTTSTEIHSNLIKWLYLPDFAKKPDANLLLFDFLLLLAASLQWQVFVDENKPSVRMQAGDNVEISRDLRPEDIAQLSPVPNFIFCRSYLDMVKVAIFQYHFWFVLCLIFLAGTTRINVLGAGYLVAFGYFMVHGSRLLLKPVKFILRPWDCLIGYSVLVVAVKTFLSVGACVYLEVLLVSHCWLVHSFGLYCTVNGYQIAMPEDESCEPPEKEAGILWDVICFAFMLIQRRIFLSYYHLYVVADLVASKAIAPRGAEMLELSSTKAWERSEEDEKKSRLVINKQMEKIKAKQKKIEAMQHASRNPVDLAVGTLGPPREETAGLVGTGDDLGMMENEEEKKWWQPWVKHPSMVLDGSYSLFETDSEEEEAAEGSDAEMKDHRPKPKTAFQLAHDAWTNSSRSALRMRKRDEGGMEREMREEEGTQRRHSGGGESLSTCEADAEAGAEHLDEPESRTRRLLSMAQFSWVLGKVLLDDITEALGNLSKESGTVMAALRKERCMWWRAVSKGKKTTTDSILRYCHSPVQETPSAAPGRKEEGQPGHPGNKELPASQEPFQGGISLSDEIEKETATGDQRRSTGRSRLNPPMEEQEDFMMGGTVDPHLQETSPPQEYLRMPQDFELEQSDNFYRRLPRLVRLAFALYQLALSKSELLCYFMIILNHTLSASILTMILPVLSFLWAMLSIPRPSRRFWMAAIYYTEATVMIKYFSQFGFLPWTTKRYAGISREKPFSLPNIIGIEKKDGYVLCDLLQLLVLFFHRSTMKGLGLWDPLPLDQDHSKGKKKSRRKGRKISRRSLGRSQLPRQVKLDPSSQEQQATHCWTFWKRQQKSGNRGRRQNLGLRKRWRLLKRKLSRKMLKKLLGKLWKLIVRRTLQIYYPIRQFFYNLTHPKASTRCDVYALTFLVEALNFAIILLGYWAFGKNSSEDLAESLSEDKVPEAFLAMVLIQFGTMIVDRALYLRKTLLGKCAFQVILVLGTHFWLFFILPGVTERRFNLNYVAQIWYLVKCIYFGLSAYQIKCGYPNRILGNFLTKSFNLVNLVLFKGFRFIPFLLELRAVIGWMWTDTALSLSNWICLEDIYANIFIMKCWQESEKKYPQPPGRKKKKVVKYGVGGVITFALVFLMWFPLVFMSLLKTVGGVTNQPLDVSVKIAINGYETLFTMSSQQQNLVPFSDAAYDQLTQQYALHSSAMQFLANYRPEDIVLVKIKSHASLLWGISPANRAAMVRELANATNIYITTSWTIQRNVSLVENVEASGKYTVYYTDPKTRDHLVQMLTHARREPVMLPALIPKALKTTAGTEAKIAKQLQVAHSHRPQDVDKLAFFRNATVYLQELKPADAPADSLAAEWWVVQEWWPGCNQGRGCSRDLELIVYNDKVSPQSLGFLAGYGIVGLYVSVVMVAAKFIREHFLGISRSIMYEELPSVDRVFRLCTDIFLVRELGELELEQQLFAKLIFLYRSPETMIKWTRECPPAPRRTPPPESSVGATEGPEEVVTTA